MSGLGHKNKLTYSLKHTRSSERRGKKKCKTVTSRSYIRVHMHNISQTLPLSLCFSGTKLFQVETSGSSPEPPLFFFFVLSEEEVWGGICGLS